MTELATALADNSDLPDFEGADVLRTSVAITNAGDGLSQALAIQPQQLTLGDTVYVVLECRVQKVRFEPAVDKDHPEDGLVRVHNLRAGRATLVDRGTVVAALDQQAEKIRKAKEAAEGIQRLSLDPDPGSDPDEVPDAEGPEYGPPAPTSLRRPGRGRS
jgi:hypothetical protein